MQQHQNKQTQISNNTYYRSGNRILLLDTNYALHLGKNGSTTTTISQKYRQIVVILLKITKAPIKT